MKNFFNSSYFDSLIASGEYDAAMGYVNGLIVAEPTARLYYERGRLAWKLGDRAAAISDYERSVALDPRSPAAEALALARDIMDFYNRDMYNP